MPSDHRKPYVIPVFIPHSGCGHRCTYCNQNTVTGQSSSVPGKSEIRSAVKHYLGYRRTQRGFTEISFYGGNFLGLKDFLVKELLEETAGWVSAGKVDGIRFSTRPDTIDEPRMKLIAPYPVSTVELGVQSMDDSILAAIKRGHSAADSLKAAKVLKNNGYRIGCQLMTGLPGEDEKSALESASAVASMKPDFVRIYPLVVLSGSALAAQYRAGRFTPLDLDACIDRVKSLYRIFSDNAIPVIRIGLQSGRELDAGGSVLAGPYHPALGHMVLSALMLDRAQQLLDSARDLPATAELFVHPAAVSRMRGLKNINIEKLKNRYPSVRRFEVRQDPNVAEDDVVFKESVRPAPACQETAGTRKAWPGT